MQNRGLLKSLKLDQQIPKEMKEATSGENQQRLTEGSNKVNLIDRKKDDRLTEVYKSNEADKTLKEKDQLKAIESQNTVNYRIIYAIKWDKGLIM